MVELVRQDAPIDAQHYAERAEAEATRRAHAADWRAWEAWARERGPTLPADPGLLAAHAAELARLGRTWATIERRLASIAAHHRKHGAAYPGADPFLRQTLAGIRATIGTAKQGARALDLRLLASMLAAQPESPRGARNRALLALGFGGALRSAELVALNISDVETEPEGLILRIRRSKTDRDGAGAKIPVLRARGAWCPVELVQAWMRVRSSEGPLFVSVDKAGHLGARIHTRDVSRILQEAMRAAGADPAGYSAHSMRAGFITESTRAGARNDRVMRHSRHGSLKVFLNYVRDADLWTEHPASRLNW